MRSAVGVLVLSMMSVGCAHQFAGTGSAVGVRAGPVNGVQASLYSHGLYGPNIAVERGKAHYRGMLMNRVVSLGWDDAAAQVRGMVDSAPTQLTWTKEGDGIRIRGLYGGKLSNLKVTSEVIEGRLGDCDYSFRAAGRGYEGRALCLSGFDQNAELQLPPDLGVRSEGEQVALISLILSGGPGRTQRDLAFTAEAPFPGIDNFYAPGIERGPSFYRPRSQ